jgi:hypothetical protein
MYSSKLDQNMRTAQNLLGMKPPHDPTAEHWRAVHILPPELFNQDSRSGWILRAVQDAGLFHYNDAYNGVWLPATPQMQAFVYGQTKRKMRLAPENAPPHDYVQYMSKRLEPWAESVIAECGDPSTWSNETLTLLKAPKGGRDRLLDEMFVIAVALVGGPIQA